MVDKLVADFYKKLGTSETFAEGAEKLAKLFIRYEESVEPTEILLQLLEKAPSPAQLEYLIYCFMDSRESDYDIILYSTRFKRLRKVFNGILSNSVQLSDEAYHIYNTISVVCKIGSMEAISIASQVAAGWLQRLKQGAPLTTREYLQLGLLIKGEAMALKMQSDWISTNTDAYNMRKMAHLLPLLSSTDELSQRMVETADKLSENLPVGEPVLTFEYTLKPDQFFKWMKKLRKDIPVVATFLRMLLQQRTKMIALSRLAAVTSIIRFLNDDRGSPLDWIGNALEKSTKKGFQIELGNSVRRMSAMLHDDGVIYHESIMCGNFSSMVLSNLIGPDRLSLSLDNKKEYTIQELVMMGMRNDTLMCRLLDNPKVYNVPRLVEHIARTSRSPVVLTTIANTPVLHSGLINGGVPLALICNPTHLPLNMLRQFINPRFISLNDMRLIVKAPYGVRNDIVNEIKNFIERKQ